MYIVHTGTRNKRSTRRSVALERDSSSKKVLDDESSNATGWLVTYATLDTFAKHVIRGLACMNF